MKILRPTAPASPDYFCRLLPPLRPTFDRDTMEKLGLSMLPNQGGGAAPAQPPPRTPKQAAAAYTYFGQFIDHDLVLDETPLDEAGLREPNQTPNPSGGILDLHHIYGKGPGSPDDGQLYKDNTAEFKLGEVTTKHGQLFDLPLNDSHCPMSAEARNTENLILRQICAMFMKLHNLAVLELPDGTSVDDRFILARRRVVDLYQYLVLHDFLPKVVSREIYDAVVTGGDHRIDWQTNGFAIPIEFSQAAFRFGHSMVRNSYDLNDTAIDIRLSEIFGKEQKEVALTAKSAIDWSSFTDNTARPAMLIDTQIVATLFMLPPEQLHHCAVDEDCNLQLPPELPLRTLRRGAATALPTGQQMANALNVAVTARPASPGGKRDPWAKLEELGLLDRIPLWYYILLEAEVEQRGFRLGALGSRLVAEVIMGSLEYDDNSYLKHHDANWVPEWKVGNNLMPINSLARVALVTGLIQ